MMKRLIMKTEYTFFTAEGVSFTEEGTTRANALRRAQPSIGDRTLVAVAESASVVTPARGKLTALIVRTPSSAAIPI
jgi:hypothetical protein